MSSSPSQHNERIAAKRSKICKEFIETTSTNLATAKHYCQMCAYDLERAVSLFYDAGGGIPLPSDDEQEEGHVNNDNQQENDPNSAAASTGGGDNADDDQDPISNITKSAKKQEPSSSSSNAFSGKGFSLNASSATARFGDDGLSPQELKIRVVFYKDVFTSQEEQKEEGKVPAVRQRGVHSFDASQSSSPSILPPKRDYETPLNRQFIQDVQQNKVPVEYRRLDDNRRPIPVSILLDDRRSKNYPIDEWNMQQQKVAKSSFSGTGQCLGGGGGGGGGGRPKISSSSTNTSTRPNQQGGGGIGNNDNNLLRLLTNILASIWKFLISFLKNAFHSQKIKPLEKHVVDQDLPTTTLAIRWQSTGSNKAQQRRERVVFNVDHTIQDLYTYCLIGVNDSNGENRRYVTEEDVLQDQEIEIMSGFPPKSILGNETNTATNDNNNNKMKMTLQEAGLLNSAVEIRILSTLGEKREN